MARNLRAADAEPRKALSEQVLAMAVIERALRDYLDPNCCSYQYIYAPRGLYDMDFQETAEGFLFGGDEWDKLVAQGKAWSLDEWCEAFDLNSALVHKVISAALKCPDRFLASNVYCVKNKQGWSWKKRI